MSDSFRRLSVRIAAAAVDRVRRAEVLEELRAVGRDLKAQGRERPLHHVEAAISILEIMDRAEELVDADHGRSPG
jgi:hypothetical protein